MSEGNFGGPNGSSAGGRCSKAQVPHNTDDVDAKDANLRMRCSLSCHASSCLGSNLESVCDDERMSSATNPTKVPNPRQTSGDPLAGGRRRPAKDADVAATSGEGPIVPSLQRNSPSRSMQSCEAAATTVRLANRRQGTSVVSNSRWFRDTTAWRC